MVYLSEHGYFYRKEDKMLKAEALFEDGLVNMVEEVLEQLKMAGKHRKPLDGMRNGSDVYVELV